jgi:hypothetical protein
MRIRLAPVSCLLLLLPVLWLEALRLLVNAPFLPLDALIRWAFVAALLILPTSSRWLGLEQCSESLHGPFCAPPRLRSGRGGWGVRAFSAARLRNALVVGLGATGALWYALSGATVGAWLLVGAWLWLWLWLDAHLIPDRQRYPGFAAWPITWALRLWLAGLAGAAPVVLGQLETRFSDEEFFVALEALALAIFWLLLWLARSRLHAHPPTAPPRLLQVAGPLLLLCLTLGGGLASVRAYQRSFFPPEAPAFPGINDAQPLLCGRVPPGPGSADGAATFERLLARVAANTNKGAADFGLLAVGTREPRWVQGFHDVLLAEARAGKFTDSPGSLKYVQHLAAARVYYYLRARDVFPDLFSPAEDAELRAWFQAINRRALTVEWVDWMYALAFAKPPEGPYENQETGAALLALLETSGLADPDLAAQNRDYLARNLRGWQTRFRNSDDAPIYQPEWIRNALLQAAYHGQLDERRQRLAFEWLLTQIPPDGAPIRQNHPGILTMADIGYLAAGLLDDPRFLWLASRALDHLEQEPRYLVAQIGGDQRLDTTGVSPTTGSCLIYGDSGLPNQFGPLAPDKLILRDGWADDSTYLMLNLRFSGWHRYKATATISLLYKNGPLAVEELAGQRFNWLPAGRSLFRDKRIPRENLNGLVVARSGLSAALYGLTGIGGPWAQDPPFYARVERFSPGDDLDVASVLTEGWRGWTHRRELFFYHAGPLVILDSARGPAGADAAIRWHLRGEALDTADLRRLSLRSGADPLTLVTLPLDAGRPASTPGSAGPLGADLALSWPSRGAGRLDLATVVLSGEWAEASVEPIERGGQSWLRISVGERELLTPLLR